MKLTSKRLKSVIHYDPKTGIFTWIKSSPGTACGAIAGDKTSNGYWRICVDYTRTHAHRLAWLYMTGKFPPNDIDHINGIRTDNRFCNLRAVSRSVNLQNQREAKSHNKSTGIIGAYGNGNGFISRIRVNGKDRYLGYFKTAKEANAAYIKAKRKFHEGCTI